MWSNPPPARRKSFRKAAPAAFIISEEFSAVKNIFHRDNKNLSPFFIYIYYKIWKVKIAIYTKRRETGKFSLTVFFYCDKITS